MWCLLLAKLLSFTWRVPRSVQVCRRHLTRSRVTRFIYMICFATTKLNHILDLILWLSLHCSDIHTTCCCILKKFTTTNGFEYQFWSTGISAISRCGRLVKTKVHRLNFQPGGITTGFESSLAYLIFISSVVCLRVPAIKLSFHIRHTRLPNQDSFDSSLRITRFIRSVEPRSNSCRSPIDFSFSTM